jgi:hypothetical protein
MLMNFSENIITHINQNVFFKEFTFDKNDFVIDNGNKVELADNVLWIDDLLIIIQIKEKDSKSGNTPIEKWFENKVLKKAKNQIKNTLQLLDIQKSIRISNGHNQQFEIVCSAIKQVHNVIIYHPATEPPQSVYKHKFYLSKDNTFMHIFTLEDYSHLCRYLATPAELNEYLLFRKNLLSSNNDAGVFPEQYLLAHFFQNPKDLTINPAYIVPFPEICEAMEKDDNFYLGGIIKVLHDTLKEKGSKDYIHIVKEFAKLNRFELQAFKERFIEVLQTEVSDFPVTLKRFVSGRSGCGFVIMKLHSIDEKHHFNALENFTLCFKYKHKLTKCIGLIITHTDEYIDLDWCFAESDWIYDKELQAMTEKENEIFGHPTLEYRPWYRERYSQK